MPSLDSLVACLTFCLSKGCTPFGWCQLRIRWRDCCRRFADKQRPAARLQQHTHLRHDRESGQTNVYCNKFSFDTRNSNTKQLFNYASLVSFWMLLRTSLYPLDVAINFSTSRNHLSEPRVREKVSRDCGGGRINPFCQRSVTRRVLLRLNSRFLFSSVLKWREDICKACDRSATCRLTFCLINRTSLINHHRRNLVPWPMNDKFWLNACGTPVSIYAISLQVTKLPVSECQVHTTCDACRGARNPYCGWCSLEKRSVWFLPSVNQSRCDMRGISTWHTRFCAAAFTAAIWRKWQIRS